MPSPRPAAGSVGCLAIALDERFCREMSCACTTRCGASGDVAILRAPASLDEKLKNYGKPMFSKLESLQNLLTRSNTNRPGRNANNQAGYGV